jgi:alpha-D-ribose 1-methylphosphonate 5-triphosphate synthase subunit PhnG
VERHHLSRADKRAAELAAKIDALTQRIDRILQHKQ